ncbi:MAG: RHS repeat-associated core domain-containing protein, partial [Bacteroides graminisolvens]|nr:RHS repeat-associated core domain-containing protein [Bacteroides graminisolvens]
GNLIKDYNKSITEISYNVLNLPQTLKISSATNTYTYAADGRKLKTVLGGSKTTDYCGNVIYENGLLKRILVDGGYIENGTYYFYLTDHLGNNRVIASAGGSIVQSNHYYPFGMSFAEGSATSQQPYKYSGKELDTERGLNLYDFEKRQMDPTVPAFTTMDPMSEKYYSMSPYAYCANNPIRYIDMHGDSLTVEPNPNGALDYIKMFFGFYTTYQEIVKNDLEQLKKDDEIVGDMIEDLEESENVHVITKPKKGKHNSTMYSKKKLDDNKPQGSKIFYDPYNKKRKDGTERTPRIGLSHELKHSSDLDEGIATSERTGNGILIMDVRAVNTENRIRKKIGEPQRVTYGRKKIPQNMLE